MEFCCFEISCFLDYFYSKTKINAIKLNNSLPKSLKVCCHGNKTFLTCDASDMSEISDSMWGNDRYRNGRK